MTGRVGRPSTGERVEVRLPADLVASIDRLAEAAGMTRPVWLRAELEQAVRVGIDELIAAGR